MGLTHLTVVEPGTAHRAAQVTKEEDENKSENEKDDERYRQDSSQPNHSFASINSPYSA